MTSERKNKIEKKNGKRTAKKSSQKISKKYLKIGKISKKQEI
jgi:hypothetical protein